MGCFFSSTQKSAGGKKAQKTTENSSDSEEDHSPDSDDNGGELAEEHPSTTSTASWSSDHNYIAVITEKTTPVSPTVLNKKCMYLFEGLELLLSPHHCFFIIYVLPVMLLSYRNNQLFGRKHDLHSRFVILPVNM